ncbi:PREDICTED: GDSL esterase/lipase 2-like [Fragaria vesca subsp. vesca]|uniref:GDSL esterase/lipase 2-like n=1 Tax=Fragaria vesca subsp. vesca TaxID=101020 RepID=UPI0002C2E1AF|nr:PREDICTED: GDSL esterase/lipase 2-like [Fragaria vesca subsp. vesca]
MSTLVYQIFLICAFSATLLPPSSCHDHSRLHKKHKALFVFGDSLFDVGNNNYLNTSTGFQSNFWPYGETFFKRPTGRFSDGRLIPDIIAEYAKVPLVPPYLQPGFNYYAHGVNFASAGAGALAQSYQGYVIDLKTQLGNFKKVEKQLRHKLGHAEAYTLLSEAVYLIAIGSNDYSYALATNSSLLASSPEEFIGLVIGNMTNVIKEIYKKGGRKFGFSGVAPLGCTPSMRAMKPGNTGTCVEELNAVARLHNSVLDKVLLNLKGHLPGFKYSYPDIYPLVDEIINNASKYGFKEGKTACCGSGPFRGINSCGGKRGVTEYELCDNVKEHVFFDSNHPTERFYQKVSKFWWSHKPTHTETYISLKELFEVY